MRFRMIHWTFTLKDAAVPHMPPVRANCSLTLRRDPQLTPRGDCGNDTRTTPTRAHIHGSVLLLVCSRCGEPQTLSAQPAAPLVYRLAGFAATPSICIDANLHQRMLSKLRCCLCKYCIASSFYLVSSISVHTPSMSSAAQAAAPVGAAPASSAAQASAPVGAAPASAVPGGAAGEGHACPICRDDIGERERQALMCGHVFCKECIDNWCTMKNKDLNSIGCPCCKQSAAQITARMQFHEPQLADSIRYLCAGTGNDAQRNHGITTVSEVAGAFCL